MTTTPDIREKVARAIHEKDGAAHDWGATDIDGSDLNDVYWEMADSALLAMGYKEMREALEKLLAATVACEENPDDGECWSVKMRAVEAARAALEKCNG